ncbi:LexA family protein [Oleidesulfovibrio sp.]|uniref:LexA family protein n=1 Tax=Oleidesulfovibrio sp. TaxID=2909707 RepID=UPI003A8B046C
MSYTSELPEEAGMVKCFGGMIIDEYLPPAAKEPDGQHNCKTDEYTPVVRGVQVQCAERTADMEFAEKGITDCRGASNASLQKAETDNVFSGPVSAGGCSRTRGCSGEACMGQTVVANFPDCGRQQDAASILPYTVLAANSAGKQDVGCPLFLCSVSAGFPSPADDYMDKKLDLNEYLIRNPESTFFIRVHGESMRDAGIYPDDILIVDRAVQPVSGRVVIAVLDGELTVKRLKKRGDTFWLVPENAEYMPVDVTGREDFSVWGVVTCVLHKV